jgi:hypothetical protein
MQKQFGNERLSGEAGQHYVFIGYATAVVLVVQGVVFCFTAGVRLRLLEEPDSVLGVSNRVVLLVVGLLYLIIGVCLFAVRTPMTGAIWLLWLGLSCLLYRVGLVWMGVVGSPPILEAVGLKCGIRPTSLDTFWKGFMAYLVIGSALVLFSEWRRTKRERAEALMQRYRETRQKLNPENDRSTTDARG